MSRTLYLGLFLLVALVLTSHNDVNAFSIPSRSSRVAVAGRTIMSPLGASTKSKTTDGDVETASSEETTNEDAIENEKEEKEEENLMEKIKESGVAGMISYAAWEWAFWAVSVPVCVLGYKQVTGHWPDINDKDDVSKLGAEAFAFVNFARFAVPLRIGLALSTTPWIKENIVDRFGMDKNEKDDENDETTTEVTEKTKETASTPTIVAEEEEEAVEKTVPIAEETLEDPAEEMKDLEEEKVVVTAVAEEEKEATEKTVSISEETLEDPAEEMKDLEEEKVVVSSKNESRFRIRSRVKNLVTRVVKRKKKQPDFEDISTAISNELMPPPPPDCQDISTAIANSLETTK